ncbi:MAG: CinA family nicotinamide mononucleotide deamidase-related protein, partial [Oscillospiraceae bacterium]
MNNKTAEIMSIGTELLLGDIVNTNSAFLAKQLSLIGINVYHQTVVGDNKERIEKAIETALERSDILITTGGLGPTIDDISKKCVCQVMGEELVLDDKALDDIKSFFKAINIKMTDNNINQAYVPKNATIFYNQWGTAPGFALSKNEKTVIMLPGVPSEMENMFEYYAKPILAGQSDKGIFSTNVKLFGASESAVEELLFDLMENGTNPTVAPYAKLGEVEVRISALAENKE